MDTLDTEGWEKEFNRMRKGTGQFIVPTDAVKQFITNLLSSRDTYWKERVEMSIGGINFRRQIKGAFEDCAHAHPEVPQFNSDVRRGIEKRLHANIRTLVLSRLFNEDNLK